MKNYLVIFTENNGARVEKDPAYIELHKNDDNVLLNPVIPIGSGPSNWIKVGNTIQVTDRKIESTNLKCNFSEERIVRLNKKVRNHKILVIILISVITIGLICHL